MNFRKSVSILSLAAILSSCGGGGGGSNVAGQPVAGGGTPTANTCSLRSRQEWAFNQINEWYLFPETLPASLDPAPFNSVQSYIDALTATARGQNRDRFFTFITSIQEENAFINSGATAGFGVRLSYNSAAARLFVLEGFEGAPALAAGLDRGSEILGIGLSNASLQSVSSLFAQGGAQAVSNALGPSTAGTSRTIQFRNVSGTVVTAAVTKADFSIAPVSPRYGVREIDNGGRKIGYVNLRTFIGSADQQLRDAYAQFRAAGINEIIIDLRYNGGGLVRTAELFADLLGQNRFGSDVQGVTRFRASKSSENRTRNFQPQPQSIAPTKIAFITTGRSASASELVINAMIPYLGNNMALIGANTFGKPVGQIGLDRAACDDRIRIVAFGTENADGNANYFNGLAGSVANSCQAADDFTLTLGDPTEASTAQALNFLNGGACNAISGGGITGQSVRQAQSQTGDNAPDLLVPDQPTPAQREVPGVF